MEFISRLIIAILVLGILSIGAIFSFEGGKMITMGGFEDQLQAPTKFGGAVIAIVLALVFALRSGISSLKVWLAYIFCTAGALVMFGVSLYFRQFVTEPWGPVVEIISLVLGAVFGLGWLIGFFELTCRISPSDKSRSRN